MSRRYFVELKLKEAHQGCRAPGMPQHPLLGFNDSEPKPKLKHKVNRFKGAQREEIPQIAGFNSL